MFELVGGGQAAAIASRYPHPLDEVLTRARQAGVVRADLTPGDFPCLVAMLVASADHVGRGWSHYLALVLDSLSPPGQHAAAPAPGT